MSQFLQGVVAGSQSTAKLFQTPVFDESAKCNSWDGSVEDDVVVIDAASGEGTVPTNALVDDVWYSAGYLYMVGITA